MVPEADFIDYALGWRTGGLPSTQKYIERLKKTCIGVVQRILQTNLKRPALWWMDKEIRKCAST